MANFEDNLQGVLETLERCQTSLALSGDRDTAQLVSVAILALRIKLNDIGEPELKALCDAMVKDGEAAGPIDPPRPAIRQRAPVSLKLVK